MTQSCQNQRERNEQSNTTTIKQLTDGSVDWITITDDSHPKVRDYFLKTSKTVEIHTLGEAKWMNPIWENDM